MIQRIQSIYLLAVTLIGIILFWVDPIYAQFDVNTGIGQALSFTRSYSFPDNHETANAVYSVDVLSIMLLFFITVIPFFTIFFFKKRKLQLNLSLLVFGVTLLYWVVLFVRFFAVSSQYHGQYHFGIQIIWPIALLLPTVMAYFTIRRDEAMISSMDRIR
jgi:hypothetical protein